MINGTHSTSRREFNNLNKNNPRNVQAKSTSTIFNHPDISQVAEFIRNKFYFITVNDEKKALKHFPNTHFFTTDEQLIYNNFYNDFGPLNLACVYRYCCQVNEKLSNPDYSDKQIVHYTSLNAQNRANAAFLVSCYAILYLKQSPKEAFKNLTIANSLPLRPFQDASMGVSIYKIHLPDFLSGIYKAATFGFFNFEDFDVEEYEKYDQVNNGDLNWLLPQKFLAFLGPSTEIGTNYHSPECYIDYFVKNNIVAVVRLNRKAYDPARFTQAGIMHYDMFLPDGSVPSRKILNQFLHVAETTNGPIAVHCKAGLGRTGALIAAYLIKHYKMTAREAIAWIRICRPGSVIGHQQTWLENMENNLWKAGQRYREEQLDNVDMIVHHRRGIYSIAEKSERNVQYKRHDQCSRPQCGNCYHLSLLDANTAFRIIYTIFTTILALGEADFQNLNKRKFTRIFAKLKNFHCTPEATYDKQENEKAKTAGSIRGSFKENHIITQGDRLNEIKLKRLMEHKNAANQVLINYSKQQVLRIEYKAFKGKKFICHQLIKTSSRKRKINLKKPKLLSTH
ncbi:dual specificity protein phosphatase CDC14C-like [Prorops nasuta]|uniref:dual specificity protein phosphatase CDC14C-like n=1 Tax=Prorops nasuta TaxID=863751 RepID=UPI0034CDA8EC